jgi:hypothetical protein
VIRDWLQSVPSMNGAWYEPVLELWSGCSDPAYNGNRRERDVVSNDVRRVT